MCTYADLPPVPAHIYFVYVCTCVRLQELFSCDTEVGHQQMSPGLEWRGLLGPQLSSQLLTPLNPLCSRPQQVIIETQRPCVGWLSHSDGLDRTVPFADRPSVKCPNLGTCGLEFTQSVCCASLAHPATSTQRAARPVLSSRVAGEASWLALTSAAASSQGAQPCQPEHVEDPRMHLRGLGILSTPGQASGRLSRSH